MKLCINRVILAGAIGRDGVEVRYNERGTAHASFMLVLTDVGQDGREHATWIPCEVWGKGAESAGELDAGQCVCFEGKLRRQKRGESWETVIAGFEVSPVGLNLARVVRYTIGIDPGLAGAIAVLGESGTLAALADTPSLVLKVQRGSKQVYDVPGMAAMLKPYASLQCHVCIEESQPMPGQGTRSIFTMGYTSKEREDRETKRKAMYGEDN